MTTTHRLFTALLPTALLAALVLISAGAASAGEHRLGVGLLYFDATDDLGNGGLDINDDGTAGVLSYQYRPGGFLSFELDLEFAPDGYAGSNDSTVSPVAWVLFGKGLYVGVGAGISFSSEFEDDVSDPFFAARVGFNFLLLPRTRLDVNVNYRADAFEGLGGADSDAITFGAILRFTIKN
jgi:hypothetical protein